MKDLSKNLKQYLNTDINFYRLSEILQDEEYMDGNRIPLKCQYCDSVNILKHYKVDFNSLDDRYKEQILEIYPDIDNDIITFWTCTDCDSIVAIKLYSHKSHNEKKIYYHKFDSFNQIIKDLKSKGYLEKTNEPCKCWYCQSDKITIKEKEDRNISICENCKKVLGIQFDNTWRILVETDRN